MFKKIHVLKLILPILAGIVLMYQFGCFTPTTAEVKSKLPPFPDFGAMVSVDSFQNLYPGQSVFKLRQDYPSVKPGDDQIPSFFKMRFDDKTKWLDWVDSLRDYCFKGMLDVDFVPQKNHERDWYHVPWLHYGDSVTGFKNSEGFHGLAKEAQIGPYQLGPNQKSEGQTYAIGFYNNFAGYVLNQMWKDPQNPNAYATQGPKGGFPHGTVIFKLLFTDLDSSSYEYLQNPFEWNGYVTQTWNSNNRVVKKMHLIQMDFMVRDTAADKYGTGWVFGTFAYNGKINNGKAMKDRVKNLVPVGIQFGNDPSDTTNFITAYPALKTRINNSLKQTFINPSDNLPPQHLGWGGRLDGPVDLNTASCLSCHATAEYPQLSPLVPAEAFMGVRNKDGNLTYLTNTKDPAFVKYFQNTRCGTPYDSLAISNDFSLQVDLSLTYFWQWKNNQMGGFYSSQFDKPRFKIGRGSSDHKKTH